MVLEGLASDWFNTWVQKEKVKTWETLTTGLQQWFGNKHFKLVIARMWDNLCHTETVEEYIKEHERIWSLADSEVQVDKGMVIQIFLRNLKN